MELGRMECMARADYQPIYIGDIILYQNVTRPKMLMIAWKGLVRAREEFRCESKQFPSEGGRHMHVSEATPKVDWHDDIGETIQTVTTILMLQIWELIWLRKSVMISLPKSLRTRLWRSAMVQPILSVDTCVM